MGIRTAYCLVLAALSFIACPMPLSAQDVGDPMPALHVTDWILGHPDEVGTWGDGKVYLVEFWGTWCAPCKPLIPRLSALQDRYRRRGLVIIGYTWEEKTKLKRFVASMGNEMRYVIVNDSEEQLLKAVASTGSIQGFPYAFLVDGKGRVAWKGNPKNEEELVSVIERLVAR